MFASGSKRSELIVKTPGRFPKYADYDGGWSYPGPVHTVGEVKFERKWTIGGDASKWSPSMWGMYGRDNSQFSVQEDVAMICKLNYKIYISDKSVGLVGMKKLHPKYSKYMQ